jgi:integrase
VDLERGEWTIPPENSKNTRAHIVHLSAFARARFEDLQAVRESEWVVSGRIPGKPPGETALAKLVKDRQRVIGLPGRTEPLPKRTTRHAEALVFSGGPWVPHDLRRSAATLMQGLGVIPSVIERCLNHSEPSALRRTYQRHEYAAERRDAFNRLGAHLERLVEGRGAEVMALRPLARG